MLSRSPVRIAEAQLDLALINAEETKGNDDIRSIGVSFLYLHILKKKSKNLSDEILDFLKKVQKSKFGLMAWTFPVEMQKPEPEQNYVSPGVIMMASAI